MFVDSTSWLRFRLILESKHEETFKAGVAIAKNITHSMEGLKELSSAIILVQSFERLIASESKLYVGSPITEWLTSFVEVAAQRCPDSHSVV